MREGAAALENQASRPDGKRVTGRKSPHPTAWFTMDPLTRQLRKRVQSVDRVNEPVIDSFAIQKPNI